MDKKPKDYKVGDRLYNVWIAYDMFNRMNAKVHSREVAIIQVNKSSIYVRDDEKDKYTQRFKMKAQFPLKEVKPSLYSSFMRGKDVLTNDYNLADQWRREITLSNELNLKIGKLAKFISGRNNKEKQFFLENNKDYTKRVGI